MVTREEFQERLRQAVSEAPLALKPRFEFRGAGEIQLYAGPLSVFRNDALLAAGSGVVVQKWLPRPLIAFSFTAGTEGNWPTEITGGRDELELPELELREPVSVSRLHFGDEYSIEGRLRRSVSTTSAAASSVIFHVLNFPTFIGGRTRNQDATNFAGNRLLLTGEGWRVTLDAVAGSSDALDHADSIGSCVITHVGKLEREDRSPITGSDLDHILHGIEIFLSIAKGLRVGVVLPVGLNENDEQVWTQWRCCQRPELALRRSSPFDPRHKDLILAAFRIWPRASAFRASSPRGS